MKNTKWIFNKNTNSSNFLEGILHSRGINSDMEIERFLAPKIENLVSPFSFSDVEKASNFLVEKINNKNSIWIYGDYDVDGITSTALSYLALQDLDANINYYIPLRDEGYGLNCEALQFIKDNGGEVVITVDCGITSHKEIEFACSIGLDVIITDHHDIINDIYPSAFAVINPKRTDNISNFKYLAGVGTVFMLLLGVYEKLGKKSELYKYLDLVALGTVADIVSLQGDNRILVKNGLEQLKNTKLPSLKALLRTLYFEDFENKIYTPYDIGFVIAPIFNAAGRLEDAKTSVEFLISKDNTKYVPMIDSLIQNNKKRKEVQEEILEKSLKIIERDKLFDRHLILVGSETFHHGVIGIVASKVLDKYYKPTIILEINKENGIAKASCRSTESFNMIEALTKNSQYLTKFGGHHGAAGFSIPIDNIDIFYNAMNDYCASVTNESDTLKPVKIQSILDLHDISYNFFKELELLEPYGFGNPSPLFAFNNVDFSDIKLIGKDKSHLSLSLKNSKTELKNSIWFSGGEFLDNISSHSKISVVFKGKMEPFRGKFYYKIYIEDVKLPSNTDFLQLENISNNTKKPNVLFPQKAIVYCDKKPNYNETYKIKFSNNSALVTYNNKTIGFLDTPLTSQLLESKKENGWDYHGRVLDIIETDFNFNLVLEITPYFTFESYGLNKRKIFQDIKEYLLGESSYTQNQSEILRKLFNDNISTSLFLKDFSSSEINNLLLTVVLYLYSCKKRIDIITDAQSHNMDNYISKQLMFFAEESKNFSSEPDFYVVFNDNSLEHSYFSEKPHILLK